MPHRPEGKVWMIWALIMVLAIGFLGYNIARYQHSLLIGILALSFIASWMLYASKISIKRLLIFAFAVRVMLLFATPNLSDDVYRFIWDGQLLVHGEDPYRQLPSEIRRSQVYPEGTSRALYDQLNSPNYFTVYPPLSQWMFAVTAFISGDSISLNIILLRILLLIGEFFAFWWLFKLSDRIKYSRTVLLYALNPMVILEVIGNLHFEGLTVLFLLMAYYYVGNKTVKSGLSLGAAIATKLNPLLFGPLFIFRLKKHQLLTFIGGIILICVFAILPVFSKSIISGMLQSLELYFNKFEFNASTYFLMREVGYLYYGYNKIALIGPMLALTAFFLIMYFSWKWRNTVKESMPYQIGFLLTIYLMFATTVHPWYIIPIVGILSLTSFKYAYIWSFVVMFSYIGYDNSGHYQLPVFWIILEYLLVYLIAFYEIFHLKKWRISNS